MAKNNGITKLALSVASILKIADQQIKILRVYESEIKLLTRIGIDELLQTKIEAAAALSRRKKPTTKPATVKKQRRS